MTDFCSESCGCDEGECEVARAFVFGMQYGLVLMAQTEPHRGDHDE